VPPRDNAVATCEINDETRTRKLLVVRCMFDCSFTPATSRCVVCSVARIDRPRCRRIVISRTHEAGGGAEKHGVAALIKKRNPNVLCCGGKDY